MSGIKLIKYLFITSIITDWISEIYISDLFLNFSRGIRILLLLVFLFSFLYHFRIIKKYYLTYYFLIATVIFSLYIQTDPNPQEGFWNLSKTLFWFFGSTYIFSLFYRQKINYSFLFHWIKIIIFISTIFTFYYLFLGRLEEEYNANAYLMVFIFPLFTAKLDNFEKHKFLLALLLISIIVTLKRGALLSISISFFIAFIAYLTQRKSQNILRRIIILFLSIIFINASYYIMITYFADRISDRFSEEQLDIEEDKAGSGRAGLYRSLYNDWVSSSGYTFLLGHGNQADSYRIIGRRTHAHSDFFGWIYNFGLVGLLLFIIQYLFLIIHFIANYKYLYGYRYLFWVFITIVIIVNFFSGFYRDTWGFYLFLAPVLIDIIAKQRKYENKLAYN
ncbi:MAG: O-antigen ligase family protein [Bacteroidales bacterium]|nr:O-antigen ligase family protein [Bacteroidales bacterium]